MYRCPDSPFPLTCSSASQDWQSKLLHRLSKLLSASAFPLSAGHLAQAPPVSELPSSGGLKAALVQFVIDLLRNLCTSPKHAHAETFLQYAAMHNVFLLHRCVFFSANPCLLLRVVFGASGLNCISHAVFTPKGVMRSQVLRCSGKKGWYFRQCHSESSIFFYTFPQWGDEASDWTWVTLEVTLLTLHQISCIKLSLYVCCASCERVINISFKKLAFFFKKNIPTVELDSKKVQFQAHQHWLHFHRKLNSRDLDHFQWKLASSKVKLWGRWNRRPCCCSSPDGAYSPAWHRIPEEHNSDLETLQTLRP